jgi:hypothetical protein
VGEITYQAGQSRCTDSGLSDGTAEDSVWQLESKVEQTMLDGKNVVVLGQQDGSKLTVANTGPAYPIRLDDKKPTGWQIDFTEHGVDFGVTAPSNALSNALTSEETTWLDAIQKLSTTMEAVFQTMPTDLTPTAMATIGHGLAGCGRELARIGSPSDRLRPVYVLVKQACEKYDEGSRCFATAARIGIPLAGSAADRKQTEAINCGFESSVAGATLADALAKGNEIRSQVNN